MSEAALQPIGDNTLIKSILSARIAETPKKKVEEVEIPEPVLKELPVTNTHQPELPEPPPLDYTEYEETPARIQKPDAFSEETPEPTSDIPDDRKAKQRQISARWGVRLYDKLQALGAMLVYDRLNGPETYIKRRDELLEKVYDASITDEEREELNFVNEIMDGFMNRRTTFHESVHMSSELVEDIGEMAEELMEKTNTTINPIWILVLLLLIQPLMNMVTVLTHKMQYNTRF